MGSLILVVENLHQLDSLDNVLRGLGARLYTYGASPDHYPLVRDAFFPTFEQFLGSEWTYELQQAWLDAYFIFSGMMLEGAKQAQKQMAFKTSLSASNNNISTTATATTVKSVGKKTNESRESNKGLLIGVSVAGAITLLLLIILL